MIVWILLGLNVLVWIANVLSGFDIQSPSSKDLLDWGGNFLPYTVQQPLRLISAMFLHGGIVHIAFNMFALYQIGPLCERFYGKSGFLVIYTVGGVLGGIASLFFAAKNSVSIGASGAIFAIQGAIICAAMTKGEHLPPGAAKSLLNTMLVFVGISVFQGIVMPHIDNAAHFGGLVAGFLVAFGLAEVFDRGQNKQSYWLRLGITTVLSVLGITLAWLLMLYRYSK